MLRSTAAVRRLYRARIAPSPSVGNRAIPVDLDVRPLGKLAISLYIPGSVTFPTTHLFGREPRISRERDATAAASFADAAATESYYFLAAVDVLMPADSGTIVAFGDSITDGDQSTPNRNGMWPAILAERLQANKPTVGCRHEREVSAPRCVPRVGLEGEARLKFHDTAGPAALRSSEKRLVLHKRAPSQPLMLVYCLECGPSARHALHRFPTVERLLTWAVRLL